MSPQRILATVLVCTLGVVCHDQPVAWGVDVDAIRTDGLVHAENHTVYTGSPGIEIDFDNLLNLFENPPTPVAPGGLCLNRNMGDRNCDGVVDMEDLATYAADIGPLVQRTSEASSFNTGSFDVTTNVFDDLYVAAWSDEVAPGVLVQASFLKPDEAAKVQFTPPIGAVTSSPTTNNWRVCATDFVVPGNAPLDRQTVLEEIRGCTLAGDWTVPAAGGLSAAVSGFNAADISYWFPAASGATDSNELVLLRRSLDAGDKSLALTSLDLGASVVVVVDPAKVQSFQLDLAFDNRLIFQGVQGVAPYAVGFENVENFVVNNINGGADPGSILPLEMDLFRVEFLKQDPTDTGPFNFSVFAGPGDFLTALDTGSNQEIVFTPDRIRPAIVGPNFATDFNGDGQLNAADVDLACADRRDLNPLFEGLDSLLGDINFDASVDIRDFSTIAEFFGNRGSYTQGDINCDGTISTIDVRILDSNFGRNFGDGGAPRPLDSPVTATLEGDFRIAPPEAGQLPLNRVPVAELTLVSDSGLLIPEDIADPFLEIVVATPNQVTVRSPNGTFIDPDGLFFQTAFWDASRLNEFDVRVSARDIFGQWILNESVRLQGILNASVPEPETCSSFLAALIGLSLTSRYRRRRLN